MNDVGFHHATARTPEDASTSSPEGGKRDERHRYGELVTRIRSILDAFRGAATALKEIRDRELYRRGGYRTFKLFCMAELKITPRTARRWIMAGTVMDDIEEEGEEAPTRECQTRQLGMLADPAARARAWAAARKASGERQPTAYEIRKAVSEELGKGAKRTRRAAPSPSVLTVTLADGGKIRVRCPEGTPIRRDRLETALAHATQKCLVLGMDGADMAPIQECVVSAADVLNTRLKGRQCADDDAATVALVLLEAVGYAVQLAVPERGLEWFGPAADRRVV